MTKVPHKFDLGNCVLCKDPEHMGKCTKDITKSYTMQSPVTHHSERIAHHKEQFNSMVDKINNLPAAHSHVLPELHAQAAHHASKIATHATGAANHEMAAKAKGFVQNHQKQSKTTYPKFN